MDKPETISRTWMRSRKTAACKVAFLVMVLLGSGCSREAAMDNAWTPPKPLDADAGCRPGFKIRKCKNGVIAFDSEHHAIHFLAADGMNWEKRDVPGLSGWYGIDAEPTGDKVILVKSELLPLRREVITSRDFSKNRIEAEILCAVFEASLGMRIASKKEIVLTASELFGNIPTNMALSGFDFGAILTQEQTVQIPYVAMIETWRGNTVASSENIAKVGVFQSEDGGSSWARTNLFDLQGYTFGPGLAATPGNEFFFVSRDAGLLFSARSSATSLWPALQTMVPNPQYRSGGPVVEGDTLHLVWLDSRARTVFDTFGTYEAIGTQQVFYRQWKDSGNAWSAEKKLSGTQKRISHASMSVEGRNIVVAWNCYHTQRRTAVTSDIYYCVSRDNGQTWSRPQQITDKDSSSPQVILHRNVIYLFYNERAGHCWNAVYRQRPFPDT